MAAVEDQAFSRAGAPSSPEHDEHDEPILVMAAKCETHFSESLYVIERRYAAVLRKLQAKFIEWAAYLGVFGGQTSNLDTRLKRRPQYRDLVLLVLGMLRMNLLQCTSSLDDKESEDSSDSDTDQLQDALSGIQNSIQELDRLAIYIRQSSTSPLDARVSAFGTKKVAEISSFEITATLAIRTLYPKASEELRWHLCKSMTKRFTRLLYWKHHDKKLRADRRRTGRPRQDYARAQETPTAQPVTILPHRSPQANTDSPSVNKSVTVKSPLDTEFRSDTDPSNWDSRYIITPVDEVPTQRQGTTSTVLRSGAKFPKPPEFDEGDNSKPCFLCRKQHVNEDLVPFVCIISACDESPTFPSRSAWTAHLERDHGAFKACSKRRPGGGLLPRSTGTNDEGNQLHLSNSCPLCCLPLDEPGSVRDSAHQESVHTSGTTKELGGMMQIDSGKVESETPPHKLQQDEKTVRFHVGDKEFEPRGADVDEPVDGNAPPQTEDSEPSKMVKTAMLNHIADHLQFLALLTPRLSTEELTDGEIRAFSSSQAASSDRPPGPRSTLEDEFDLSAGGETDGPGNTTISIGTEISESQKDIQVPPEVPEETLGTDDSGISTTDDWAFLSLPKLVDAEDDSIVKDIQESRAQRNRLLDAALGRLQDLGLALSHDGHDAWVRMESRLKSAQTRRNEDEPGGFIPLPEQHKAITLEDLRSFFDGLFRSLKLGEHYTLVEFCAEQVWAVQPCPDLHQPKKEGSASRRRLFAMLLIHGSPSTILVFIRQEVSDLIIPIDATTIARYLPDWSENAIAALIQDQRQFLSDDELAVKGEINPMLEATRDAVLSSLDTRLETPAQVHDLPVDHGSSKPTAQVRPASRGEYQVAIFAASEFEVAAAAFLLDTRWYEDQSSDHKPRDDTTTYVFGSMSGYKVVIACIGKVSPATASAAATNCSAYFPNIRLALIAGVCHAVPFYRSSSNEINEVILGDVIISDEIVEVSLERHTSAFSYQKIKSDTLGGSESAFCGLVSDANDNTRKESLHDRITTYLNRLREDPKFGAEYPGAQDDNLFGPTYQPLKEGKGRKKIGHHGELVPRHRLDQDSPDPLAHIGLTASSNVLLSGKLTDEIAEKHDTIAFEIGSPSEMETSPLRYVFPSFLMVMGVRGYTDSHQDTIVWRRYAAAVAAACTKALLEYWKTPQQGRTSDTEQPKTWFVVPYARNHQFVGRGALLERLRRLSLNSAFRARLLLYGLGGIGKTQIALEHACWFKETCKNASVFWVQAKTEAQFHKSYHAIAEACGIPVDKRPMADISWSVRVWLDGVTSGQWLMVIDDVDDAGLFSPEGPMGPYIPDCSHGSFLVTTRNKRAALELTKGKSPIQVDFMDERESVRLLRDRIEQSDVSLEHLSTIACRLGYLPLVLDQVARFINTKNISVDVFLEGNEEAISDGLRRDDTSFEAYAATRKNVWHNSFKRLQQQNSFAADLLGLMAFLDPESIAIEVLSQVGRGEEQVDGRENVAEAVDLLQAHSFVSKNKDSTLNMHRLVQHEAREWLSNQGLESHFAGQALLALSVAYPPSSYENWATCRAYLPHVYKIMQHEGTGSSDETIRRAILLDKASLYLLRQGQLKEAESLQLNTIELRQSVLGNDHPLTVGSTASLGSILFRQGRLKEAEKLWLNVIAHLQKVLGEKHVHTLNVMSNLVSVYETQGRLGEAERLGERVAENLEEQLSPEHPDILSNLGRLTSVYRNQGRLKEAEKLGTRAMDMCKKVLGTHHPQTLSCMSCIASIYHSQGRSKEAEKLEVQVMERRKNVLGPHHPDTLISMGRLGMLRGDQGRQMEAENLEASGRRDAKRPRLPADTNKPYAQQGEPGLK